MSNIKEYKGYNLLETKGDINLIKRNRKYTKELYDAHLWIHNGIVEKNHTNLSKEEIENISV